MLESERSRESEFKIAREEESKCLMENKSRITATRSVQRPIGILHIFDMKSAQSTRVKIT